MSTSYFILSNFSDKNICLQMFWKTVDYLPKYWQHSTLKPTRLFVNMSYFNTKHLGQLTCLVIF